MNIVVFWHDSFRLDALAERRGRGIVVWLVVFMVLHVENRFLKICFENFF